MRELLHELDILNDNVIHYLTCRLRRKAMQVRPPDTAPHEASPHGSMIEITQQKQQLEGAGCAAGELRRQVSAKERFEHNKAQKKALTRRARSVPSSITMTNPGPLDMDTRHVIKADLLVAVSWALCTHPAKLPMRQCFLPLRFSAS